VGGDQGRAELGGDEGVERAQDDGDALREARGEEARSGRVGAALMLCMITLSLDRFKRKIAVAGEFSRVA
jgi:hypothetical protein